MKINLTPAARDAIKEQVTNIDEEKWTRVYRQLHEQAYQDSTHPLIATDIGQITRFFEQECNIDPLAYMTVVPRHYHCADNDLTEFIIPNHIEMIDDSACRNCRRLTKVVIPNSVKVISDEAFFGCNDLEYIEYEGTIAQFELIDKGYRWWRRGKLVEKRTIKCSDGDIKHGD